MPNDSVVEVRQSRINFVHMIALGDTLISEDVFDTLFACDLSKCKGACCVEGESGAPLTEEEVDRLEGAFEVVKPMLRPEALAVIEEVGLFEVDQDGEFVTPIINGRECVYATFESNGTAKCAFESAWRRRQVGLAEAHFMSFVSHPVEAATGFYGIECPPMDHLRWRADVRRIFEYYGVGILPNRIDSGVWRSVVR